MNIKAEKFAHDWKYNWYGFWYAEERHTDQPFDLSAHIDENWLPPDKDKIIEYLKKAPNMVVASNKLKKCHDCEEKINTLVYRSDGVLFWPDCLSHYVEKHCFRLPDRFVHRIRERNYNTPPPDEVDMEALDWP
ncbi:MULTISPECIES: hypothetical protein [unclassified Roseofilum]|uniref:hypothetical protein n=1 Tax=unclassified Roseofilum TaxID=2620099 RepID=UPI001B27F292|nr:MULTISPECIES: hypothetical protein [unclassified Roseofilum]MBP0008724.1 hypothetical protein [Roseofilum sp. Belize Diploria]MBP0035613.1 hypothetical protein [Roseofilum sp. Belize BBD 4]